MFHETHPELLRRLVEERHETLRHEAVLARLRREARAHAATRRRARRARRAEHRPVLVAPPPVVAE